MSALEEMQDEAGGEVSAGPHQLLTCILTSTYIASISITTKVLVLLTLLLSRYLQAASLNLIRTPSYFDDVEAAALELRESDFSGVLGVL